MKDVFEVHLAVPKFNELTNQKILKVLTGVGFAKNKYFQKVRDLKPITMGCTNGHDLENPGIMATSHVASLEEAVFLAQKGMFSLKEEGIEGVNFEIERVLFSSASELRAQVALLFSDYKPVPNSPQYENHLIYKGCSADIPSDEVIRDLLDNAGLELNQIVDFTNEAQVSPTTIISRVATIYQSTKESAQESDEKLRKNQSKFGNPRIITEEVLFVGEFMA